MFSVVLLPQATNKAAIVASSANFLIIFVLPFLVKVGAKVEG